MNPVRIIFFDIDGTLVDHATGCVSGKTFEALRRLRQNGILLCIATGRAPVAIPDFGSFHFDAYCTFNGSFSYAGDRIIHSTPLLPEDVSAVIRNAAAIGRPVTIATREEMAANGSDQDLADYYRLAGLTLTVSDDFDSVRQKDVYQIMLGCRPADHPAITQGTTGVKMAVSWDRAADVIPAASGKAASIAKILEHFHLDASQAMAFGDGLNDMQMLQAVGTGVAMGNGAARLKEMADDICAPVSEDGIYHYCIEHGLI